MRLFVTTGTVRVLRWGQRALFAVAASMLMYCGYVLVDTWRFQKTERAQLDTILTIPVSSKRALPPAGSGGLIGRIDIASLGLSAVLMEGTTGATLRRAVGHISGTALPGQPGERGDLRTPRYVFPAVAKDPFERHHYPHHARWRVPLPGHGNEDSEAVRRVSARSRGGGDPHIDHVLSVLFCGPGAGAVYRSGRTYHLTTFRRVDARMVYRVSSQLGCMSVTLSLAKA